MPDRSFVDVELLRQLSLLVACCILMDNALGGSLVDGADRVPVKRFSVFITVFDSVVKPAKSGLQLRLFHTVAQILLFGNRNTLDSGFDVGQSDSPPVPLIIQTRMILA